MVLNTSPEDGRNDVQLESRVGFQIDATIDPATLTNDTFYVTDSQGTRIAGTLAIDEDEPDVAGLTPAEPFLVIASFTATITTGLASSRGATLEQNFEWQFTTLDSAWGVSEWIEQIDYEVDPNRDEAFYAAIRSYWPDLPDDSLVPGYSGVRPKLVRPGDSIPNRLTSPGTFRISSWISAESWNTPHR